MDRSARVILSLLRTGVAFFYQVIIKSMTHTDPSALVFSLSSHRHSYIM